jgi:hypothetical protein
MTSKIGLGTAAAACLIASGCAKSPESIAPSYVSPMVYQKFECDQLAEESQRVEAALTQVSAQQRQARSDDTVGVILLGLPVSSMSGGNVADQVAALKGQQQTLRQVITINRCVSGPATPAS